MAGILLGLLLMGAVLVNSISTDPNISTLDGGSGTVEITRPDTESRAKPTTLTVSPGRTTVVDQPIQRSDRDAQQGLPPETPRASLNWAALLQMMAPPIGAAVLAWRYGRQRMVGPLEEVNLGVYKGAMPLEMISARHKELVFTKEQAHRHLFGFGRERFVHTRPSVLARPGADAPPAAGHSSSASRHTATPSPTRSPEARRGRFERIR